MKFKRKLVKIKVTLHPGNPTKRAPDAGDSVHIPSSFLRLSLFLAGRLRRPRPSAGNANRQCALARKPFASFSKLGFVQSKFESSKSGFVFQQKFWFVQVRSFSGGEFPNFIGLKISSSFWFKKFRFKFAQVVKISFKFFRQSFCKQVVSFCQVYFCWLAFCWVKSGFQNWLQFFCKSFGKFGSGFFARFIFSGKVIFS